MAARDVATAWTRVAVFAAAVEASLGKWLGDRYSLGLTEYRALGHLSRAADKELRVSELAHRVGLNQSSVTRLVGRLEAKGLARRDVCMDDGRGIFAVITEQGESLLREVTGPYEAKVNELLSAADANFPQLDARAVSRALGAVAGRIAP